VPDGDGTINFPTSASPAAQAPFLTGTKAFYNFEFDLAAEAFQQTEKADPNFALAYWGEAMSFNHPLWAEQDLAKARHALEKLAPPPPPAPRRRPPGRSAISSLRPTSCSARATSSSAISSTRA
jgi:hypothetical protein